MCSWRAPLLLVRINKKEVLMSRILPTPNNLITFGWSHICKKIVSFCKYIQIQEHKHNSTYLYITIEFLLTKKKKKTIKVLFYWAHIYVYTSVCGCVWTACKTYLWTGSFTSLLSYLSEFWHILLPMGSRYSATRRIGEVNFDTSFASDHSDPKDLTPIVCVHTQHFFFFGRSKKIKHAFWGKGPLKLQSQSICKKFATFTS